MKPPSNRAIVRTVLVLGLLVGTLDILAAILDFYINTGKNPSSIFKYISSAILGKEAFTGGTGIIIIGLFLHYGIAFLFTIFFVWLHVKKKKLLPGNRLLTGIVYGIFIWMVMNLIIVPLSGTQIAFCSLESFKSHAHFNLYDRFTTGFFYGKIPGKQ
ncbi:MAG TPA: hypothetical protein VLB84_13740 [Bacteroidia bacterium]|nr:hypothetical protein [Bacteroidia bacterium]